MINCFLLLLALVGLVNCATISQECRLSDIKSIIGGHDYTVDDISGIHFVHL